MLALPFGRLSFIAAPLLLVAGLLAPFDGALARAAEGDPESFDIGEAARLTSPQGWVRQQPRTRIVDHEFMVPAAEGDSEPGRVTIMGAGGGVEANVERWREQFMAPGEQPPEANLQKLAMEGAEVYTVDISGTFQDKPGPFVPGPAVQRENYRMLGAIIVTPRAGSYFVKFYGPAATVAQHAAGFQKMISGLEIK